MSENILSYDAGSIQRQSWKYHMELGPDRAPQTLFVEETLEGIDPAQLDRAIEILINRHDSLRTFFIENEGIVKQCIVPYERRIFMPVYADISSMENAAEIMNDVFSSFNDHLKRMDIPPLFKYGIFKISGELYRLCILVHHIICDTWSISVMKKEVRDIYMSLLEGSETGMPPLTLQLKDYVLWRREWLEKNGDLVRRFWSDKLGNVRREYLPGIKFQSGHYITRSNGVADIFKRIEEKDRLLGILNNSRGASFRNDIDSPNNYRLMQLSVYCKSSVPAVINASLKLLFLSLAGREKILIALPVIDRSLSGSDKIIGHLVGGAYLYQEVGKNQTIKDLIKDTYIEFMDSARNIIYDHDEMQLDESCLRVNSDIFMNYSSKSISGGEELRPEQYEAHLSLKKSPHYALSYTVSEYRNGLVGNWIYNTDLFSSEMIEFIAESHLDIIEVMCREPNLCAWQAAGRGHGA